MRRLLLLALFIMSPARAVSPEAEEFIAISKELEPVQCERRKLRREIMLAEIEQRGEDAAALRRRFATVGREPATARLEKRLAELEPRLRRSRDAQDLEAISREQRDAFYQCD